MGTQRALSRRGLLACATLPLAGPVGCAKRDRASVLAAIMREVVTELTRDLLQATRRLHGAARALHAAPCSAARLDAQRAFTQAVLSWKRANAYRGGPFATSQAFQRAAFWPARPAAVEAVLGAAEPIDESRVEALGVDARGLFALEYLLFEPQVALADAGDARGQRGGEYALELSANILGYARRLERLVGDGARLGSEFARGGQRSLDELVATCADSLAILSGKLERVRRGTVQGLPGHATVEGYYSRSSHQIAVALLEGTQRLYVGGSGGGLSELVRAASEPVDEHVAACFETALARLRALSAPLELTWQRAPTSFEAAATALASLDHVLRVEMASALEA